jgi:hypothetical protein
MYRPLAAILVPFYALLTFAGSPREALLEMALSEDPAVVERHLPTDLVDAIKEMKEPARSKFRTRWLPRNQFPDGANISAGESDNVLFSVTSDQPGWFKKLEAKVQNEVVSGTTALLKLRVCQDADCSDLYVGMKYQEHDWRLTTIETVSSTTLDLEYPSWNS